MQAIQEPIEDTGDNDGGVDLPCQSEEDRRWQLHVGDVVQIVQGHSEKRTYALYFGQGRVIHAWTPSRQSFRVRVDSLRGLQLSGYTANIFSRDFDAFILQLLKLAPLASAEVIRRAKMALHATTSSRVSSLSFILFARYGDSIPVLLQSLKKAYQVALSKWMFGSSAVLTGRRYLEGLQCCESPLDDPVRLSGHKSDVDEDAASSGSFIKLFLGTNGEHLLSEWLGRSLADFFNASATKNPWYAILMPPATNHFTPLFLLYDKSKAEFQLRFQVSGGLPERMASDRMECGVCWMDFTPLRVMVLKCSHYICDACLRLLPRRECPYCRAPIRFAHEVSEHVKKEALRLLKEVMALEDKPPANEPEDAKLAGHKAENNGDEETSNGDEEPNDDNH